MCDRCEKMIKVADAIKSGVAELVDKAIKETDGMDAAGVVANLVGCRIVIVIEPLEWVEDVDLGPHATNPNLN